MSERRSCAALGVGRSSIRYRSTKSDPAPLRMRICDLAKSRVRYGYFPDLHSAVPGGLPGQSQEGPPPLQGRGLEPAAQAAASARQRSPAGAPACRAPAERALVYGLRLRRAVRRPPAASPDDRRCIHARGSGDRGRPRHQRRAGRGCRRPLGTAARSAARDPGR